MGDGGAVARQPENLRGARTREALVEVAEELFAEQGVGAVSVRSINAAAGQGAAAVHYHFGTREALLTAVLLGLGQQVSDELIAGAQSLAADARRPSPEQVVGVLLTPYFDLLDREPVRGTRWLNVVGQLANSGDALLADVGAASTTAVAAQVARAFPGTAAPRRQLRWSLMSTSVIMQLGRVTTFQVEAHSAGLDFRAELAAFAVAALQDLR